MMVLVCILTCCASVSGQLAVSFGAGGLQKLSYGGVVLEDTSNYSADAFHIWHMKVTDLQGNILTGTSDGWGENSTGKTWDQNAHAWTYQFPWGSIRTQYVQTGNTLDMIVTEVNRANSGEILAGASIYPLALHFPALPAGFVNASYPRIAFNTTGPSALVADFGAGEVASVAPDASKPLYSGFWPSGSGSPVYTTLISSTTPDGLATFQPHNDRPVGPGQTDTFTVSLRFAPSGTPIASLAMDAYASWAATWPPQLQWTDKRIIGTAYLASSPTGSDVTQAGGFPNNPRRYFNDGNAGDFDIRTPMGLSLFQNMILQRANDTVSNLQRLNAQGVITWDLEGEEYPQNTTYVCSPDQIGTEAPEMESIVTGSASPYNGMKLDDAYFKIITSAGFRVGVCIRPQQFIKASNGTAQQVYLTDSAAEAIMLQKITYAHTRWGATLFYLDSTVEQDGAVLDAGIFQRLAAAFPDSLLIPEESTPKHYAYTAPFLTFLFHRDLGTDSSIYGYYPHAFSCNLVNDVDPATLAAYTPQLIASVAAGDILMAHADYWQQNNPAIMAIYQAAGVGTAGTTPPPTPAPPAPAPPAPAPPAPAPAPIPAPVSPTPPVIVVPPVTVVPPATTPPVTVPANPATTSTVAIQSPAAGDTLSGVAQVVASVARTLDAAGSYLMVDGQQVGTARVNSAPFNYSLDTTTLASGQHTLQIWAHDTANEVLLSNTVAVAVFNAGTTGLAPAPPPTAPTAPVTGSGPAVINYPLSGQAVSGVVAVSATVNAQLDAAGSYLMVDGQQFGYQRIGSAPYLYTLDTTGLLNGSHSLQLWAHTVNNQTILSAPVMLQVSN